MFKRIFIIPMVLLFLIAPPVSSIYSEESLPDLQIARLSLTRVPSAEVTLRLGISITLKNTGAAIIDSRFVVRLRHRLNTNEPWQTLQEWEVRSLGRGETRDYKMTADFEAAGTHYFRVEADAENEIPDQNKTNNIFEASKSFEPGNPARTTSESWLFSPDENQYVGNTEVVVTAPRMEIALKENPAAMTVVETEVLRVMPKALAADEAFKLVPGVKVDNQANGERVHLSIRGQGILTERGIRGIKVLLDGLPLNDPSGFAPDLFDVDWATLRRIEVFRGVAGSLYGGSSAGGILNILTRNGYDRPIEGGGMLSFGSYGFFKGLADVGGTTGIMNYRISASRTQGDGYRQHTKFWAKNYYGKFRFDLSPSFELTAITGWTDFFNENAEGLNLGWLAQDRKMANPDAITFNEYQKTRRITGGIVGKAKIATNQDLSFAAYVRDTHYKESVPSSIQHRSFATPGFSLQYNLHAGQGWLKNHFSAGADLEWQSIKEYRHRNLGRAIEGEALLSDQTISQRGAGVYLLDRVEMGPDWGIVFSLRRDNIRNELEDKFQAGGVDLSGVASFQKSTGRVGVTWNPAPEFGLYSSWGTGFLPPATEELANNPDYMGGFNTHLVPATSKGEEIGARGSLRGQLYYDLALFHLRTDDDFGRYRIPIRPLETFYRNVGSSKRYGLESFLAWYPVDALSVKVAYTYSDFKYISYTTQQSTTLSGTWLPNSPAHQGCFDVEYYLRPDIVLGGSVDFQSRSYIDATNAPWIDGFALFHLRIGFRFQAFKNNWELLLSGRNITGKEYIAFTEPDPDGNSYQPGPTGEYTLSLRLFLGER